MRPTLKLYIVIALLLIECIQNFIGIEPGIAVIISFILFIVTLVAIWDKGKMSNVTMTFLVVTIAVYRLVSVHGKDLELNRAKIDAPVLQSYKPSKITLENCNIVSKWERGACYARNSKRQDENNQRNLSEKKRIDSENFLLIEKYKSEKEAVSLSGKQITEFIVFFIMAIAIPLLIGAVANNPAPYLEKIPEKKNIPGDVENEIRLSWKRGETVEMICNKYRIQAKDLPSLLGVSKGYMYKLDKKRQGLRRVA